MNVLFMEFTTSISVSENTQNKLGDFTHPICSTISVQIMTQFALVVNGNHKAKAPTWFRHRVLW